MYTWMRPGGGMNSLDDFQLLKAILLPFIDSNALKEKFTSAEGIKQVKEYILHVLNYENLFFWLQFRDNFDLEIYSNSAAHEGTNNGIKSNNFKVRPNQSLGVSTNNLAKFDNQLFVERWKACLEDHLKVKLWTTTSWTLLSKCILN